MQIPNCLTGMPQREVKGVGSFDEITNGCHFPSLPPYATAGSVIGPPAVPQFNQWANRLPGTSSYGMPPYPYQMFANQVALQNWNNVGTPDLQTALQLAQQPVPVPSKPNLAEGAGQATMDYSRLASSLQMQASCHDQPFRWPHHSPSQSLAGLQASSSSFSTYTRPNVPARNATQQGAQHTTAASHLGPTGASRAQQPSTEASGNTSVPASSQLDTMTDDVLMRAVKGDFSAMDMLSKQRPVVAPQHLSPKQSTASTMWSKPGNQELNKHHSCTPAPTNQPSCIPHYNNQPPATSAAADQLSSSRQSPTAEATKAHLGEAVFYHIRMKMLSQQEQFLNQVWDLHRLVSMQKLLSRCLQHPEHAHAARFHAQSATLKTKLQHDLQLLQNIPRTLRKACTPNSTNLPDPAALRITKDSPQGRSLPCPVPQKPVLAPYVGSKSEPLVATSSAVAADTSMNSALPSQPYSASNLPFPRQQPSPTPQKPPLIRPIPTALQPSPLNPAIDMHALWMSKHSGTVSKQISGVTASTLPPPSFPSQLPSQLTGLSSDCIGSFGQGLSSLTGAVSLGGCPSLSGTASGMKEQANAKTRVTHWWQDEAATFGDVSMPDDMQVPSKQLSRAGPETSSVGHAAKEPRSRAGDPCPPPKKRAKFQEGSIGPSSMQDGPQESGAERQTSTSKSGKAAVSGVGKDNSQQRPRSEKPSSKCARSKRSAARPVHSGSGGSDSSTPGKATKAPAARNLALAALRPAAVDKDDSSKVETSMGDNPNADATGAKSAANILLSISSSFLS